MKNILAAALIIAVFAGNNAVFAGELENISAGAENALSQTAVNSGVQAVLPAPGNPAALAGASEYKKLAAAFEKGTAPAKADLTGWNAGRFIDRDMPDTLSSMLLAGGDAQPIEDNPGVFKIVPMTLYGSPEFYEKLPSDIAGGVAISIQHNQSRVTAPVFSAAQVEFEVILPSYNKGYARFAVRKAADGRILVKHTWQTIMGPGPISEGVFYGYFTKNVTPR